MPPAKTTSKATGKATAAKSPSSSSITDAHSLSVWSLICYSLIWIGVSWGLSIIFGMSAAPIVTDPTRYEDCLGLWDRLMAMDFEKGCFSNSILGSNSRLGSNLTLGSKSTPTLGSNPTGNLVGYMWRWGWGRRAELETIAPTSMYQWPFE